MTEAIGGYFGTEPLLSSPDGELHPGVPTVNIGRSGLRRIMQVRDIRRLWIPDYNCRSVVTYLNLWEIPYETYAVDDDLEPALPKLSQGDALVYVNYFGLKTAACRRLETSNIPLILDLTQAFYYRPLPGTFAFSSARKFFGLPDGGYVFGLSPEEADLPAWEIPDEYFAPLRLRASGDVSGGYAKFKEIKYYRLPTAAASAFSRNAMQRIDYAGVAARRRENFAFYRKHLQPTNLVRMNLEKDDVPLCYPYRPAAEAASLRAKLIERSIFVPIYWPKCDKPKWIDETIFLPLDQRYGREEMQRVIQTLMD